MDVWLISMSTLNVQRACARRNAALRLRAAERVQGVVSTFDEGMNTVVPLDAAGVSAVRENIQQGTPVFDSDEKELGTVQAYDGSTGYMRIEKGVFFTKDTF